MKKKNYFLPFFFQKDLATCPPSTDLRWLLLSHKTRAEKFISPKYFIFLFSPIEVKNLKLSPWPTCAFPEEGKNFFGTGNKTPAAASRAPTQKDWGPQKNFGHAMANTHNLHIPKRGKNPRENREKALSLMSARKHHLFRSRQGRTS